MVIYVILVKSDVLSDSKSVNVQCQSVKGVVSTNMSRVIYNMSYK